MKSKVLNIITFNFALLVLAYIFMSNNANPPDGFTGAPGEGTCSSCHSGGTYSGDVSITGLPSSITAGQAYPITITLTATSGSPVKGGFQCTVLNNSNNSVGNLVALSNDHGVSTGGNGRQYVDQRGGKSFSGGSVSWTYQWTAPSGPNGLPITIYGVGNFTNANNNSGGDNAYVTSVSGTLVANNPPPNLTVISTNVTCNGANNGTASAIASDGTPPYSYLWSNAQSGPNISNLAPGTYKVTVTDAATLTATGMTTITQPTAVLITVTNGVITCANPVYTIISTANGGVAPYTYSWSNGESTPNINVSTAGTYMLTVTDANGCTKVKTSVVIANTTPPTVVLNAPTITCTTPTVQISSTVTGGKVPYTYLWSNNQTTPNIMVNNAGPFTVTVTDANGCSAEKSITVTLNNTPPTVNIDAPPMISCASPQVQINASSTPLGNNLWTTTNGHIVSGKTTLHPIVDKAGTYVLTVTIPSNGCSTTQSTEVKGVSPVKAIASFNNIHCFGDSNSIATISVSGGLPPYTYIWSNGQDSSVVDSLPAGNYTVIVKDKSTCVDTVSFTITQPPKLNAIINSTDQTGPGKDDGTAVLTPSGGSPPYKVLWSTADTTYSIDSLAVGSYTVTLTDSLGCATTQSAFISPYNCGMAINTTITKQIDCFGQTGTICADIQGGTPPYNYSWSNGAITNCLINAPAGVIGLTVTDAVGCKTIKQVELTQPPEIKLTPDLYTIIPETAFNSKDASIIAMATGGTAPFVYSFDKGLNGSLPSGDNIITVTDSKGCQKSFTIFIAPYNCDSLGVKDVTFNISKLCYQQPVTICIAKVTGGFVPYSYLWSDNTNATCYTTLPTGIANLTITDAKNCTSVYIKNYDVPTEINVTSVVTNASVANNDGSIVLTVTGGAFPLTYQWSNSSTSKDQQNLSAGNYCVTITDANACTKVVCTEVKMEVATINLEEGGWNLFPNPAKDLITLQHLSNINSKLSWYIFDEYGKVYLKSKETNKKTSFTIPIDSLSPGNYFIQIQDSCTKLIGKFVKN